MIFSKAATVRTPSSALIFAAAGADSEVMPATFFHAGYPAANTITSL